jgi:hypothetical protein
MYKEFYTRASHKIYIILFSRILLVYNQDEFILVDSIMGLMLRTRT